MSIDREDPERHYCRPSWYGDHRPASGRPAVPPAVPPAPSRPDICDRCDALPACCHCDADVGDLRLFATRMAMIHQPTRAGRCGCGTHNCYVRARLDPIRRTRRPA